MKTRNWLLIVWVLIVIAIVSYAIALALEGQKSIFDLAIRFCFSGFAALAPVMLAALFWRRSNKWGAVAAVLWMFVVSLLTPAPSRATIAKFFPSSKPEPASSTCLHSPHPKPNPSSLSA